MTIKNGNISRFANYYLQYFENIPKDNKTITVLKKDAPEELKEAVSKACDNQSNMDFVYEKFYFVLDTIANGDFEDIENIEIFEIVDGLVDVYTHDLTEWLHLNVYYLTEALQKSDTKDGFQLLMQAQGKAIEDVASEVLNLLEQEND